ncbi:AgmX/PglI C-terminal domain-containing protein [Aliikangiella marina]|uniref:AgmX/PglI C-terminal domain-containing protein n=1 Tax=Aliikangiella marina TaxID=1712262 RepID=A0A545T9J7_9GAMM|nr:AgmX/PglI C-terminal domain-containing protein [Aliikangiella marina]TQV73890.1 AgmX/PglI C-terminal domain-containing protein [Aliikangiella marina]
MNKIYILVYLVLLTGCSASQKLLDETAKDKTILISKSALESYEKKYIEKSENKAFAQSYTGAWAWRANFTSIEHAVKAVYLDCLKNSNYKPCKIVNINGEWTSGLSSEIVANVNLSEVELAREHFKRQPEEIRKVFDEIKKDIFVLYLEELKSHPTAKGKLNIKFLVMSDGTVKNLELIRSELGVSSLEEKILSVVSDLDFGTSVINSEEITYTFTFFPE